jgi:hypothetical protein
MAIVTIPKKEYKELLKLKERLEQILKKVSTKREKKLKGVDLLDFAKLKIKGGTKDLSEKINFYLYEK